VASGLSDQCAAVNTEKTNRAFHVSYHSAESTMPRKHPKQPQNTDNMKQCSDKQ